MTRSARRSGGRVLRGVTGLLAGGLVALVVALGVAWVVAAQQDAPGPGVAIVGWHVLAAVAAVLAQLYADRHPDRRGVLAALAVVLITVAVVVGLWVV